ncbi:hypothetical protein [Bradyrhizobium sp. USDA 3458]|uniref:hypothetical protein n=1 Tax=Bradyrhizobium sp. USDA 3458 TaxID=2591461 RepID=UPI001144AADD|nr:hypothetical protein [Bradyrhizobium sp. USDA 3458]
MRVALAGRSARRTANPFMSLPGGGGGVTTSVVKTLRAPIGGWNARDALPAMKPEDAIQLDNFIPDTGGVKVREGYAAHATGLGGAIESLMEYNPPSGSPMLFAATSDKVWDCTTGSVSTMMTGLGNGRWQHTMFSTAAGHYLVAANGVDLLKNYDGSTWSTPSITGVLSSDIVNVAVHAQRLWLVPNNSLSVWYLDVSSIAGAATELPLGQFCKLGGYIVAMASWTRDGGNGMDDVAVFITSKGEAVLYSGTDPSSPDTWTQVGAFRIPEPIGRRCVMQAGADLGLITSQGVMPFSSILPLAMGAQPKAAITDKISGAFTAAYDGSKDEFGWQLIQYPKKRLMLVNIPIDERITSHQYVMNTQTGGWCRFKGMNAGCWSLLGDDLYFGGNDGTVYKYGGVYADNGDDIQAVSISAYSNFGTVQNKSAKMARPMFNGPDGYLPLIAVRADYDLGQVNYLASSLVSAGSFWDEAEWDVAEWALSIVPSARWQSVEAFGSVLSVALAISVSDQFQFNTVDLMFEGGGYL